MRWIHIAAGVISITSGAIALVAFKGGPLHRRSGMVFVYAMLALTSSAVVIAALLRLNRGNVIAGLLTLYLVVTGLLALRLGAPSRRLDLFAMTGGFAVALLSTGFGLYGMTTPNRMVDAYPAPAFFIFAVIAGLLVLKDRRMIAARNITRGDRLKRHIGRMGGAMLIATGSLFLGQPQVFEGGPLEAAVFRAVPVLIVVAAMVYWRYRISRPQAAL